MRNATTAAAMVLIPAIGMAQVNCKSFERAIDDSLRAVATDYIAYGRDDSAARHTNRLLRAGMEWTAIGIQIDLMAQNKCPPLRGPVTNDAYMALAKMCVQKSNEVGGARAAIAECDPASWKRPE